MKRHHQFVIVCCVFLAFVSGCTTYKPETAVVEEEPAPVAVVAPSKASDQMLWQAQQALNNGDLGGAIASAERGLRIDRRNPELYMVLAKAYARMDDFSRASQFAEQAVRFSPVGSAIEQSSRSYLSFLKKRL